ncbi:MAG: DNA-3-methyladenine glycosylase 2 family protein [Acidimicrobiia bacterium]
MDRLGTITSDVRYLARQDPRLASPVGVPPIELHEPGFHRLVHLILGQQVSIESAGAMYANLVTTLGAVTPEALLRLDDDMMRRCGFTRMKAGYARGIAEAILDGFDLSALDAMGPDAAVATLTTLRGVGVWTAECYLLFAVGHRDIFPAGDLALRVGWQEIAALEAPPSEQALRAIAEQWAPRRTAAAHLVWDAYLRRRGRR